MGEVVTIGEVAKVRSGFAFKSTDWQTEGIPVIKIANVKDGAIALDGCSYVNESIAAKAREFELVPGDIVISMTGYIGEVAKVRDEGRMLLNQRVGRFVIRDAQRLDAEYFYQYLRQPEVKKTFADHAYGAAQPNISPSLIEQQTIILPDLPTQRRIAGILSAYDELIANNQRRIAILEEMARALYREWFVHYRAPGVVMGEDGVPEGWEVKRLREVAQVHRGRSYRSDDLADEGGLPFLNLKCMDREGGFRRTGIKCYTGEFKEHHVVRKGDIIMAVTDMTQERAIVARAAWVPTLEQDFGVMSMDLVRIEPKAELSKVFLYCFLRYSGFPDEVKQHANGANVLHLSPDRITDYPIVLPTAMVMNKFEQAVIGMLELKDTLENQSANLRRTRDLLLPRLMSGRVELNTNQT